MQSYDFQERPSCWASSASPHWCPYSWLPRVSQGKRWRRDTMGLPLSSAAAGNGTRSRSGGVPATATGVPEWTASIGRRRAPLAWSLVAFALAGSCLAAFLYL
jgi:hypothetical protein